MGFIYKIVINENIYVGSTKRNRLCFRQGQHNYSLRNGLTSPLYIFCREHNIKKILCEKLEEVDNKNIFIKEQEYINKLNPTLNTISSYRTEEEEKEYYNNNKNKIHKRQTEKIKCELCNREMNKSNLSRHKKTMTCKKFYISMLDTDSD
tara:strand:+ start:1675 stop:2124 length:450 start_codon:yes stop_codon:yes gene_type:complete